ncbi:class I SAM-dependent methyltransferase [Sphingomonas montanisoli]|uniref:Class I SAM-dependent methyltransferase n=1 Tax=Sphingomonas montanisoli TaxID=2606412 RepID=A0A5D9CAR6_9SPHN|nr:class I SAM-dependent methyltransferase [Sphingomonas montanisoli]TZG28809.1 class I SAM-dependent methyltransferase [Sphingomonas montanisoli]
MTDRPVPDRSSPAQTRFEEAARAAKMKPDDAWVEGYADYEWDHLRPLFAAYDIDPAGKDVLEFGCNVGGSAVVLAALGARLTAIDIDAATVAVARANLDRHGFENATTLPVPDTRAIPLRDAGFDVIVANSVLEYVPADWLAQVFGEFHRLLRPGGHLLICGTASRLSPIELHSRRWGINWLPRAILPGEQRGLGPIALAKAVRGRFVDASGDHWVAARRAIHGRLSPINRAIAALARSPGWIAPYIELLLLKP